MTKKIPKDRNCNGIEDPRIVYADIIDLPHHEPDPIKHPRMPLIKRAAQFAPFAALSGYDDMIAEENRKTEVQHMRDLEDYDAEILNQKIRRITELTETGEHPTVSITYYEPDIRKSGGKYVTITDAVKRVDSIKRVIELMSIEGFLNKAVKIDMTSEIHFSDESEDMDLLL